VAVGGSGKICWGKQMDLPEFPPFFNPHKILTINFVAQNSSFLPKNCVGCINLQNLNLFTHQKLVNFPLFAILGGCWL